MPALEKASIDVLAGTRQGARYRVLFNPSELSIEHSNSMSSVQIPGLGGTLLQFVHGEAQTLSMDLFLDDFTDPLFTGGRNVEVRVAEITALMKIDQQLHAPPQVRFVWGLLSFKALLERVTQRSTMFHPTGRTARATLSVTFRRYQTLDELLSDPRLESSDRTKSRLVVSGDTLWALAAREYGDPARWRTIAEANDLDDPRAVEAGQWVTVPSLEAPDATS